MSSLDLIKIALQNSLLLTAPEKARWLRVLPHLRETELLKLKSVLASESSRIAAVAETLPKDFLSSGKRYLNQAVEADEHTVEASNIEKLLQALP